jgi:hypothetical protein
MPPEDWDDPMDVKDITFPCEEPSASLTTGEPLTMAGMIVGPWVIVAPDISLPRGEENNAPSRNAV